VLGEVLVTQPEKKKKEEQKLRNNNLVAAKPKMGPLRDHFEKMLEAPCPYHEGLVKHALNHCNLMKSYLDGKNKLQDVAKVSVTKSIDHDEFPKTELS
jgi:hypothetical protein